MNILRRNLPNALTCINILAGCVAIVFTFHPLDISAGLTGWQWACIAIAVAVAADFLDGFTARLLKAWSAMGKELDSLSDLVSFGVAPAMLMLNILAIRPGIPAWLPWLTMIIPVAGVLRLARFNVDTRQTSSFIGLPIPANALFWIGYVAVIWNHPEWGWLWSPALIIPIMLFEAWLMVSPLPLFALKFHDYGWKGNECRWILIAASAAILICIGLQGLIPIILFYLLLSAFSRPKP